MLKATVLFENVDFFIDRPPLYGAVLNANVLFDIDEDPPEFGLMCKSAPPL